ncbi:MAG: hypothetical protein RLP44_16255 [Aggregatilineales bacterium]
MTLFVIFVFGAVVFGAGAMLAPAFPTQQPRIALAAAFALAIIVGGTIFYAMLFGWDTLVIDYLLFALVVGIFLGGTLSVGQSRAESRGEVLEDKDQGWPGPQDLAIALVIALIFLLPTLILPVTLGTQGASESFLAVVVRDGESLDTLAPFYPAVTYVHAPGISALIAYLSQQLAQGVNTVHFDVGAIIGFLCIWLAYDLGGEQQNKRLGRANALAMLFGLAVFGMFIDGYTTSLLALSFMLAFVTFMIRFMKTGYPVDALMSGLLLGAVLVTQLDIFVVALFGWLAWLVAVWIGDERPSSSRWLIVLVALPLIALVATTPWLLNTDFSALGDTPAFVRSSDNLTIFIQYHGIWSFFAAMLGAWLGWMRRDAVAIFAVIWLLLIFDYSVTGGLTGLFPFLLNIADPALVARVGPVIPYTILGGSALLWLFNGYVTPRFGSITYRGTYMLAGASAVIIVIVALIVPSLRNVSLGQSPALASSADVRALEWLRENTEQDGTRVLNFYLPDGGAWAGVISERDSVYLPPLPYSQVVFVDSNDAPDFEAFWQDPANESYADDLRDAGITHVFVPEILSADVDLNSLWRFGAEVDFTPRSSFADAEYLEAIYAEDGAVIYAVRGE